MASKNIICYSDKYYDDKYEYRHVVLPKEIAKLVPKKRLMTEDEWRAIGVQMSPGWVHYMIHKPESHHEVAGNYFLHVKAQMINQPINLIEKTSRRVTLPHMCKFGSQCTY